jgi:hypothetical protein
LLSIPRIKKKKLSLSLLKEELGSDQDPSYRSQKTSERPATRTILVPVGIVAISLRVEIPRARLQIVFVLLVVMSMMMGLEGGTMLGNLFVLVRVSAESEGARERAPLAHLILDSHFDGICRVGVESGNVIKVLVQDELVVVGGLRLGTIWQQLAGLGYVMGAVSVVGADCDYVYIQICDRGARVY